VFTGPDGGPLRRSGFYRRHFKPEVTVALQPELHGLRFHDLRHTCARLLIAAGVHAKSIQVRLGHSTIQMTMDVYGHLLPSLDDALAATLNDAHEAARTPENNVVPLRPADDQEPPDAAEARASRPRNVLRVHPVAGVVVDLAFPDLAEMVPGGIHDAAGVADLAHRASRGVHDPAAVSDAPLEAAGLVVDPVAADFDGLALRADFEDVEADQL
jgi:hypothetical protein